jgi:hypothetical protein
VERFEVFGPKVLAGIGVLPDTIVDRSLPIRLKRRAPDEQVERFRHRDAVKLAAPIREVIERWAETVIPALTDALPRLPDELDDRAQDVVEPLLAIADLFGDEWASRARAAVVELKRGVTDDESLGVRLLADVRALFARGDGDRISSAGLLAGLREDPEGPWHGYLDEHSGPRKLARRLKPYGIRSQNIRFPDGVSKGYAKADFEDAWTRYLPSQGSVGATTATTAQPCGFEPDFDALHQESCSGSKQASFPLEQADVAVVAAGTTHEGGRP